MLLTTLVQTTDPVGQVANGSGAVAVVGFVIVGFGAVIAARIHRKRRG